MIGFWIVYILIAAPCILYTGYALTAHTDLPIWLNILIYALLTAAWFSMMLIWNLRANPKLSVRMYRVVSNVGYFMLGYAFILLCALGVRDFLWMSAYLLLPFKIISPFEASAALSANLWVLGLISVLSIYAVWAANRMPRVLQYGFADRRIRRPLRILALSDWHINKTTAPQKVKKFVQYFNVLEPDVIVMAGDITDDFVQNVGAQLRELKKLRAPLGIFITLGNHEVYHSAPEWESSYAALGWQVLHNSGAAVENCGVYIGGVPSNAGFLPAPEQAMRRAADDDFRILLAHEPAISRYVDASTVDIQFSGHTHGGQIFPFHFPVKWGNAGFVGGAYNLGQTILLVSNGAGYWGPPMRLLAPSDVLLIELKPQPQDF
ncbi:MAG: metallophosphoesterase [Alphaproteobacteria bacterium]|nr:metallophosphoesterase [Alphaproteobacteria bacterium]MBR1757050.1 metallophosphoesterase [Alphaproteobacteria bacterium]